MTSSADTAGPAHGPGPAGEAVPLSDEDVEILRLESDTVVGHTCKIVLVGAGFPGLEALRDRMRSRLPGAPELRRRLEERPDGHAWVDDDAFVLDRHVVAVDGGPYDENGLRAVVASLFAQHLDRAHPLWRLDLVPLAGGRAAAVWRVHHALADGTTMMRLARTLLWDEAPQAPSVSRAHRPSGAADDQRRRGHLAGFLTREFTRSRGRSPFDGRIGTRREIAFASAPLSDLHAAAKRLGDATLNDAVLTVVAGGLRRWVMHHHGHLGVVRVKVPVSLHHEGEDAGNRDSFFTVGVPLNEADPVRRLRATHEATAVRKSEDDAETMDHLLRNLAAVSPSLERLCAHLERSPRSFAVNVSNVVGPRAPVSVLQAPVEGMYTLAEVGERHALRVAVVSLAGTTLNFGLCADPGVVADVAAMASGIEEDAATLVAAAGRGGAG